MYNLDKHQPLDN